MPIPCESWPSMLAYTRFSATRRASPALLPPAATIASMARVSASCLNVLLMESDRKVARPEFTCLPAGRGKPLDREGEARQYRARVASIEVPGRRSHEARVVHR